MTCLEPCPDCPFGGPKVGSKGNPNSKLVIIGESPGKNELKDKIPFVGDSGKVLDLALLQEGGGEEPFFINALQCWSGKRDDKDPEQIAAATKICANRVLKQIAQAPREVVLALGSSALWSVTENYGLKITQERGKVLPSPLARRGIIPSVHPAFIMSGGANATFQQFMRDVKYARSLAQGGATKKPPDIRYRVAQTYRDIVRWSRLFTYADYIAADIETSGFDHLSDRILCVGFSLHPGYVYVVPEHLVKHVHLLFNRRARYIWHNGKFDVKFLWQAGITNARCDEDTMLLSYALDEIGGIHDLEQVASDWLNSPNWKAMLEQHLPKKGASYSFIPKHVLHHYMALDIGNTHAIFNVLRELVRADKHLEKLYTRTLMPASTFLAKVESRGIHVDLEKVKENDTAYLERIAEHKAFILAQAETFTDSKYTEKLAGSPKQLKQLLYEDLGLKAPKGKEGTGIKILEKLNHPVVESLKKYRKVAKEHGTYIKPLLGTKKVATIIRIDGRVHCTYLLHGTRTGRLASRNPNLQNVPRNPIIRGQYVAAPGRRLVEVDLNQAELRILACFSKDPELCKIYTTAGMSLHDEVRAEIWGHPKDYSPSMLAQQLNKFRLTPETRYDEKGADLLVAEQKMRAKNVNFGVVYGITASGLAEQTESPVGDCQSWIDKWFGKFRLAGEFIERCKNAPFEGKTLITPFGNKKRPNCVSKELARGMMNEYANFPEQSSASHCTLHAGVELEEELSIVYDAHVCNLIHDALLIDAPDDDEICAEVAKITIAKMEEVPKRWGFIQVPFVAEAKQGYRWGSLGK
jgi:DNA polymerase-1